MKSQFPDDFRWSEVCEMYRQGMSVGDIALKFPFLRRKQIATHLYTEGLLRDGHDTYYLGTQEKRAMNHGFSDETAIMQAYWKQTNNNAHARERSRVRATRRPYGM